MRKQSRLEEISRRRSLHRTIIILAGIMSLIVVFFFYGVPLLINLSLLAANFRGNKDTEIPVNTSSYIAPPVLDPLRDATNSAQISITGYASRDQVVRLYVNGKYIDKTTMRDNKSFTFQNVILDPGDNDIKVKAVIDDRESGYSQNTRIVYKNKAPDLEITSPQNNQTISNGDSQVRVEGRTDPSARVTINDYWAIVESDGSFSYLLRLQKGDNTIKALARDDAGNRVEKEIKIKLE